MDFSATKMTFLMVYIVVYLIDEILTVVTCRICNTRNEIPPPPPQKKKKKKKKKKN